VEEFNLAYSSVKKQQEEEQTKLWVLNQGRVYEVNKSKQSIQPSD
jgi:hypothetical protein